MKYAVWFVRLVFAAWMIPAGLNHFIPLFPQPMGSQPLSHELIVALIDSHLFDLVKAVELLAGISVLTGFYTPLALILCMPVSFCVFYWDAPLEGWGSRAALFGYSVLICNVLLCLAYVRSYRSLWVLRAQPRTFSAADAPASCSTCGSPAMKHLVLVARLVFGAWMLVNGANHFFLSLWPAPTGHEPLAAATDGRLRSLEAVRRCDGHSTGRGSADPQRRPGPPGPLRGHAGVDMRSVLGGDSGSPALGALVALVAFGLNGGLMLAYIDHYRGVLARHAPTLGEV